GPGKLTVLTGTGQIIEHRDQGLYHGVDSAGLGHLGLTAGPAHVGIELLFVVVQIGFCALQLIEQFGILGLGRCQGLVLPRRCTGVRLSRLALRGGASAVGLDGAVPFPAEFAGRRVDAPLVTDDRLTLGFGFGHLRSSSSSTISASTMSSSSLEACSAPGCSSPPAAPAAASPSGWAA